jgi:hypothetical protein
MAPIKPPLRSTSRLRIDKLLHLVWLKQADESTETLTGLGPSGNDHLLTLISTKNEYACGTNWEIQASSTGILQP